jgi:hypothetical protein
MLWCRSPAPEVLIGTPPLIQSKHAFFGRSVAVGYARLFCPVQGALRSRILDVPQGNVICCPLVVVRVIRPLSWVGFTPCIVQGMFILTCVARPDDGLCWNMMFDTSPDCGTTSFRIDCSRGLGGKMRLRSRGLIRCIYCNGITGTRCGI